jgi:hypothetical protein
MTTPTPRAALKGILARLANLPACNVVWDPEPEPSVLKPPASLAISGATNASPIVLTLPTTLHLSTGMPLVVANVSGNTAANGTWNSVTLVDGTHVSLDGSTGNGAYTSGGTASPLVPWRWGLLRVSASSRSSKGWDDFKYNDNGNGTFSMKSFGGRRIVLGIDYFSFDPALTVMADDVLEDVRTKIWHPDILDALNQNSLVAVTYGDILKLPRSVNGRELSAAHLDIHVRLAVVDNNVNEVGGAGGVNSWIMEGEGTGTITREDGTTTTQTIDGPNS